MAMELTPREQAVADVLAEGRSNKEIARRLNITEGTVKVHLNHIFQKLGIYRRVSLIVHVLKEPK